MAAAYPISNYSAGTGSSWSRTLLQVHLACGISLIWYSLNSHCFEEHPHCHNRTHSYSSKYITCINVIVDWSQTIRNSLRLCFHIVVSSLLRCYSSRTTRNDKEFSISCVLFAIIDNWSEMNVKGVSIYANCLWSSYRKVLAIVCDGVTRIWKLGFNSSREVPHDFTRD